MRNQWIAGVVGTSALVAVVGLAADPVVTLTSGPLRFEERLLMKGFTYSFGVAAGDIDGDGDLDLTAADALPNNSVYLFTNDGNRGFQRSLIQKNDPQRLERHQLGDIDGDGRLDLVIVKNLYGDVLWFRNDGSPRTSLWKRHAIVSKKLKGAYDVALADFDRDGDLDVAASSWRLSNNYVWFENDGSPADGEWTMRIIDEKVNETRMIRQADIDGDKDPDLVCTARRAPLVVWYENTGNPRAGWKKHVIDEKTVQPIHGMPVDMDRDGDVDVLLACGMTFSGSPASEQIVWYENAGGGRNWKRHTVARSFHGAFEAIAVDLDGDKDMDVVATSWDLAGSVTWFENTGDPKIGWKRHAIKTKWARANQLVSGDFDGDGRPDLAAGAERGSNEVRWWRNAGPVKPRR